ncbi:GNAT family N-acetyltransferase ['Paenibacillus yunnanensis' Narsing Rao et al. 2020]|uniref:GNAT family N-acetyltransferase n=1 Tax=Paenibacillus tengchongensis TaxID=2608684 RepID=UPI00124D1E8A|nr:GNAT family N-acetyltransferase [Paenibacillus tengchongensis]
MIDVYTECPSYAKALVSLRQTREADAEELLRCYSDCQAVPFFNSDNCHGDDFHYETVERMKQAIDFWDYSYTHRYFVRWTVIHNETGEMIGTIEMFHRIAEDEFNHFGVLRIDLRSTYETAPVITELLEVADDHFFELFNVNSILTKAVPEASERIAALLHQGYQPLNRKLMIYDDYFVKNT